MLPSDITPIIHTQITNTNCFWQTEDLSDDFSHIWFHITGTAWADAASCVCKHLWLPHVFSCLCTHLQRFLNYSDKHKMMDTFQKSHRNVPSVGCIASSLYCLHWGLIGGKKQQCVKSIKRTWTSKMITWAFSWQTDIKLQFTQYIHRTQYYITFR